MFTARLLGGDRRDILSRQKDLAACGGLEPGEHPHHRGLATAGGAEQCEELFFVDIEGLVINRGKITETLGHTFEFNQRLGARIIPRLESDLAHANSPPRPRWAGKKPAPV